MCTKLTVPLLSSLLYFSRSAKYTFYGPIVIPSIFEVLLSVALCKILLLTEAMFLCEINLCASTTQLFYIYEDPEF